MANVKTAVSIEKSLFELAERIAREMKVSRSSLFALALQDFIHHRHNEELLRRIDEAYQDSPDADEQERLCKMRRKQRKVVGGMVIQQGDIFWIELDEPSCSDPGYTHPHVVVQNNVFNRSRINRVIVCALSSNLKRGAAPGHVLLEPGEANLPRQSVVIVFQLFTVDKSYLGDLIGTLSKIRVRQILDGIDLILEPREIR